MHSINEVPLILYPNNANVAQIRAGNIAFTTSRINKLVGDLTKPESDFVRKISKDLMMEGKMVRASDLLLAYNSGLSGGVRSPTGLFLCDCSDLNYIFTVGIQYILI